ncbi:hypothetical protein LCGC14_0143000 [marine sediment metagenome]|uniref:Uncharacterized protein n=1 Tax=marine sediment metagenome TaxID=412755 RepID=A0A0F9V4X9_9ZZZZ
MNQKQRDLLVKMLQGRAKVLERELDKQFPKKRGYRIQDIQEYASDFVAKLCRSLTKTLESLASKQTKLDQEQKQLDSKWDEFEKAVESYEGQLMTSKRIAVNKLSTAMDNAIVEIQFAEDVEVAKAILGSLPSLDQLIE